MSQPIFGPDGKPAFSAQQQVPADEPKKCQRCGHWHPPLLECVYRATLADRDRDQMIVDLGFEIAAIHQAIGNLTTTIGTIFSILEEANIIQVRAVPMGTPGALDIQTPQGGDNGQDFNAFNQNGDNGGED